MHISVFSAIAAAAWLLQLCLTLCDPMGCNLPGSSVHGIFLTQGLNPGFLHCRQILYRLSHRGGRPAERQVEDGGGEMVYP